MGLRISGKKALVQLQRAAEAEFDISGVGSDGRSRANDFNFTVSGNIAMAEGYNEDYIEHVPTGQSTAEGSMTAFYNAAAGEVEDYLWTMYEEQHVVGACADVQEYTLYISPEGDCSGKTKWTINNIVIKNLNFPIKHNEILVVTFDWGGWKVTRATIA